LSALMPASTKGGLFSPVKPATYTRSLARPEEFLTIEISPETRIRIEQMKIVLRNSRQRNGFETGMKMSNSFCLMLLMASLVLEAGSSGFDAPLVGGQPIPVGANDGVGPLPSIGISSTPLGFAYLDDEGRPDIFVSSDRWHPGFQLYKWIRDTPSGVPVFSQPIEVDVSGLAELDDHILQDHAVASYIFQTPDGKVHGIWVRQDECAIALFDSENTRFEVVSRVRLSGLPRLPRAATGFLGEDGQLVLFLSVSDGVSYKPTLVRHRNPAYRPFDGSGIWMGGLPRDAVYRVSFSYQDVPESAATEQIVSFEDGGNFGINGMTITGNNGSPRLVIGTLLGGLHAYSGFMPGDEGGPVTRGPVVDENGISLRHPETWTTVISYPSRDPSRADLLISGEGGMYYYQYLPGIGSSASPAFMAMGEAQQVSADLFGGTLVVPTVVDWNGDRVSFYSLKTCPAMHNRASPLPCAWQPAGNWFTFRVNTAAFRAREKPDGVTPVPMLSIGTMMDCPTSS
jgi:hypothetical protein